MNKLRGTGTTFSTSGKPWQPFQGNAKVARRNARLHRLKRKGLTPPADKTSLRALADEAAQSHPIRKVPPRAPAPAYRSS